MEENVKLKVIKAHPTVDGMLYKDEIVMVDKKYKSFINQEKIKVRDLTGKIWFVETKYLKQI
mgnify:FL=1